MDQQGRGAEGAQSRSPVERRGDLELVITRTFNAPPGAVFRAWSQPALFQRWWMPKSLSGISLVSCDMEVRSGGKYRLEFSAGDSEAMAFYGKYIEVVPDVRIVWTNDEGEAGAITTVTFESQGGTTMLRFHEAYPSKEAREEALQGSAAGLPEQLDQVADLLSGMGQLRGVSRACESDRLIGITGLATRCASFLKKSSKKLLVLKAHRLDNANTDIQEFLAAFFSKKQLLPSLL